ncbi:MAG: hypothetical protein WBP94_05305 [Rhodomicrobiaceae bacterium]
MTTIVDFRHGRSAAACLCPVLPSNDPEPSPRYEPGASHDGAEIILFPKISRERLSRPRKSLNRRFAIQARHSGEDRSQP